MDGQTGFVWKLDRSYFIGVCPHYKADDQTVTMGGASRVFDGINVTRDTDQLILYTPQYNDNTLTDASGVEVLVELSTPLMTPPSTVTGTIKQVRVSQGSTSIPFDHLVLSGVGTAATFLQNNAHVGQQATISQDLQLYDGPLMSFCDIADSRTFNKAYALAQGNWVFLKNGVTLPKAGDQGMTNRNPRTAVAYNASYVFFMVCDGRAAQSVGMTSDEMAAFCKNTLGATDGVNMDGGGSSTMWINGVVKNNPSDGSERAVANGLMMVNLLPKLVSTVYSAGQTVTTTANANMRLGPGTDYYAFTAIAKGTQGSVASHAVNGVYAKGYYWWKCSFGANTGWVAESLLATSNSAPSITQQPVDQFVGPVGAASFTVLAAGSYPLGYRWQKNQGFLSDGGHYSGSTTNTLAISNVDSNDAASYRCVVTNAYGSATSSPATLTLVTNAFGSAPLNNIPTLSGDTANEARAITSDGRYVVGLSGSRGFLYDVDTRSLVNVVSSDGAQSAILTGVGYRTNSGQREVIVSGLSSSLFTAWMTIDGGATWGAKAQYTDSVPKNSTVPLANGLAGGPSGVFCSVWTDEGAGSGDNWSFNLGQFSVPWVPTAVWDSKGIQKPQIGEANGISSTKRAVGWRQTAAGSAHMNYLVDGLGTGGVSAKNPPGLVGDSEGEMWSVSADGTVIFGISPIIASNTPNYGYKATFSGQTQTNIARLPNYPDAAGSANLAIPYGCTADGKYAVGMNYRGTDKAVLWDTHDASATNWTVTDLTDLAVAGGNLNIFSCLTRAYSVGTNRAGSLVIAGVGLDTNSPARTRAFVMTVALSKAPVIPRPTVTISSDYPAGLTFSFVTVADSNILYYLDYTTNLTPPTAWTAIDSTLGNGGMANLSDTNPADSQRFYRIRVQ